MGKNGISKRQRGAMAKARAARSAQGKPPAWKDNPASNASFKFAKYGGFVRKLLAKMKGFPFGTDDLPTTVASAESVGAKLDEFSGELRALAATGFKPARMRGKGWTAEAGMQVFLKPEGRELVGQQVKLKGKEEFFLSDTCDTALKMLPVRIGGAGPSHPLVGFLPKNVLSNKDASA